MKTNRVWFDQEMIYLETEEGKTASLPLKDYPRLYHATSDQKEDHYHSPFGIHWPQINEDLSYEGFFKPGVS